VSGECLGGSVGTMGYITGCDSRFGRQSRWTADFAMRQVVSAACPSVAAGAMLGPGARTEVS